MVGVGHAAELLPSLSGVEITEYHDALITPGFIDTHIHCPQTGMIASYGEQLLGWLNTYTFPTEQQFADKAHAAEVAGIFLKELLRNGTTLVRRGVSAVGATGSAVAFCPTSNLFLGSGLFDLNKLEEHGVRVGLGTDVGAGTSFSQLQSLNEAYKVMQLQGKKLDPFKSLYLATLGGAHALYLDDKLGNFKPGKDADFVVLDYHATPLISYRTQQAKTLEEKFFALIVLGDDRAIKQTFAAGQSVHCRD